MKAESENRQGRYCAIQRGFCFSCVLYEGDSLQEARCAIEAVRGRRCQAQLLDRLEEAQSAPQK